MTHSNDIIAVAKKLIGPLTRYVLGAEVGLTSLNYDLFHSNVDGITPAKRLDCSEATQAVAWHCGLPDFPDGAWQQAAYCRRRGTTISIESALSTPGALLFKDFGPGGAGGNGNHVGISLGDGTCIEARGSKLGCGIFNAKGRGWNYAALFPDVDYTPAPSEPLPPPLAPPLPPPTGVSPMFDPPIQLQPIVAEAVCPSGGFWLLASDWGIYCFGGAPFHGNMMGHAAVEGRSPARLIPALRRDGSWSYMCVATSGETYGVGGEY